MVDHKLEERGFGRTVPACGQGINYREVSGIGVSDILDRQFHNYLELVACRIFVAGWPNQLVSAKDTFLHFINVPR